MPSLVLRNVSVELHDLLKHRAERNHRSMTKEAVAILEKELAAPTALRLPDPVPAEPPLTVAEIAEAVKAGRE
ncbi:MAG TPA: Arc family DNA-binding protein [Spirochaetia bacterium]|nr:Arc family DNA-binding protein [Spirochaetia bacterium]